MKQVIFVALMVVSGLSFAEGQTPTGANHDKTNGQTTPVFTSTRPKQEDPFNRLNQLVNACLVDRSKSSRSSILDTTTR